MRFRKKLCPLCPNGLMRVQKGKRGFYYRCDDCHATINGEPERTPAPEDPVFLKFHRQPAHVG